MWLAVEMLSEVEAELKAEADRLRAALDRERRARIHRIEVHRIAAETSGKITRRGVARVIADGASDVFGSRWAMVAFVGDDDIIQFIHGPGVPDEVVADWQVAPLDVAVPVAAVLRGELASCALQSRSEFTPWPVLMNEADRAGISSLYVEPICAGDRPHAVIALGWQDEHELDGAERELLDEMIDTASPAFARALKTEADNVVASTLQDWLLPADLPEVVGLEIAALYEPGKAAMDVGGDWYDVVVIDERRASIVIGDVVGHDARAAAEMGQVRHVLASHLLATGDPVASLRLTDQYFSHRVTDTMATALVLMHDTATGTLQLASAGHLPPVLVERGGAARLVDGGLGPPIGSGLGGYESVTTPFPSQAVLVAFTDGVVELRDETIDEGIAELCGELDRAIATDPTGSMQPVALQTIIDVLVRRSQDPWRTDDAAAVVVRAH